MKQERPMVVLAAVIVQITLLFAPAQGQESHDNWLADSGRYRLPRQSRPTSGAD